MCGGWAGHTCVVGPTCKTHRKDLSSELEEEDVTKMK